MIQHDSSNDDQSVNKASQSDTSKYAGAQQYSEDDLIRQYSEIGEDANSEPDDDY